MPFDKASNFKKKVPTTNLRRLKHTKYGKLYVSLFIFISSL